jgi:hypothetical protein
MPYLHGGSPTRRDTLVTTTTQAPAPVGSATGSRIVLAVTSGGIALNLLLELVEAAMLPDMRADLVKNVVLVVVWSLVGLAITLGLVRLGGRERLRTPMAWTLAVLGLLTVLPMFWAAIPATLASGALQLAKGRPGSVRAARVVAIVAVVAFAAVSIGMFPFSEV